jgi:mRNA-degrading endonuclease YafQ of YafQ-DinJ toxin-antitoxin module
MKTFEITETLLEELKRHVINDSLAWENYTNESLNEAIDVKVCHIFSKLNKKHIKNKRVQDALLKFLEVKGTDIHAKFGGDDYPMTGKGPLQRIKHAKLTRDISIMYEVKAGAILLLAIGSHDDLGFGNPSNINKQQQLVKKINACKKIEGF